MVRVALIRPNNIIEIQPLRPMNLNEILVLGYPAKYGEIEAHRFHFHKKYKNGVAFKQIIEKPKIYDENEVEFE